MKPTIIGTIILFWTISVSAAIAQINDSSRVLGHVKPSELTMTVYAPDSSAEAVVLEDRGTTYLSKNDSRGYFVEYKRYTRIKILNKSGLDYANVRVPFYNFGTNQTEDFTEVVGRTYNGSQFQEMLKGDIFEEKKTEKYSLKKFSLPNVREGSIIEYSYTIHSDLVFNLRDWNFQREIPTLNSTYVLYLIPGFEYRILFQGVSKLATDESTPVSDGTKFNWAMTNIPALKKEPYITELENHRAKVYFELIATTLNGSGREIYSKSWDDLDKTLITSADFGAAMNKSGFVKDSIEAIKKSITENDTMGRVAAVYDFVRRNMNYNGKETYFVDKNLKDAYQKRSGSAAEINLMIVAMLRELDIPANPVILSTRSNGRVSKEYPLLSKFDYVIANVEVGGKDLLLDATDKFRRMGTIPFDCLNDEGRLIAKKSRWVLLKPAEKHSQIHSVSLQITAAGQFKGKIVQNYAGYAAAELRKKIFEINQDRFKEEMATKNPDWQLSNVTIENVNSTNESVQVSFDALIGDEKEAERFYLNPIVSNQLSKNPFKKTNRIYPIDFGTTQEQIYVASLTLPPDYVVEELPKNMSIVLPNGAGRFIYATQIENNTIKINTRFTINRTIFEAAEYDMLREFYDKIVTKQAELMVLKKK